MNSALCLCALGVLAVVAAAGIGVGLVVGSVGSFITSHDCLFHSNNKACACELVSWRRVREGEGKGTVERKKLHATKKDSACVCVPNQNINAAVQRNRMEEKRAGEGERYSGQEETAAAAAATEWLSSIATEDGGCGGDGGDGGKKEKASQSKRPIDCCCCC